MDDNELLRYSRHILLPEVGIEGQEKLLASQALIIGAGGLGSPIALYLAASGIGNITICDGDTVDMSNLQRQIAHPTSAIGINKALSAQQSATGLNPRIHFEAITHRVSEEELIPLAAKADVIIDASDNFETRHAINRVCVKLKKPLVSGAAVRFDGQVTLFDLRDSDSPCYHCLFPNTGEPDVVRCAENGIFSPLVGIIGSIQAAEAMKVILGIGDTLKGRLWLLDALAGEWRTVKLKKDPHCPVCGTITG